MSIFPADKGKRRKVMGIWSYGDIQHALGQPKLHGTIATPRVQHKPTENSPLKKQSSTSWEWI